MANKGEFEMFSYRVDEEISIELLQQHHKEELYNLIDSNREHLRKWLLWVDKRKSADDFEPIIPSQSFRCGLKIMVTIMA
jgi:hypothetical protein